MANLQIHEQYIEYVKEAVALVGEEAKILKADCFNEARNVFPVVPLYRNAICVEINQDLVNEAKEKGINAVLGDIRNLSFEDESFDLVVDLSTIDHIWEVEKVIKEYNRVLRPKGILLIVCWFNTTGKIIETRDEYGMQYFFLLDDFKKVLLKFFDIINEEPLPQTKKNEIFLYKFLCKKK